MKGKKILGFTILIGFQRHKGNFGREKREKERERKDEGVGKFGKENQKDLVSSCFQIQAAAMIHQSKASIPSLAVLGTPGVLFRKPHRFRFEQRHYVLVPRGCSGGCHSPADDTKKNLLSFSFLTRRISPSSASFSPITSALRPNLALASHDDEGQLTLDPCTSSQSRRSKVCLFRK